MNSPLISIIVPVYKAEKYLKRCLDSLLSQTLSDFELILIDDGSPDKSGDICDKYAEKDMRIKVIHQENSGVSAARQCGLDISIGEYIIHADPDDWVEPNMLEDLYSSALTNNSDMVICDFFVESKEGRLYNKQKPSTNDHTTIQKELFLNLHGACWNKLIKRVCFEKYNVRFPKGISYSEDKYVISCLLNHELNISYVPNAYYHHDCIINENSLIRSVKFTEEYLLMREKLISLFLDSIKDKDNQRLCKKVMAGSLVFLAFVNSDYSSSEFKKRFYKYKTEVLKSKLKPLIKFMCYLSCIGFYHSLKQVYNLYRKENR